MSKKEYLSRRAAESFEVPCVCPKCGVEHVKKVNYTGRLPARYACDKHRGRFSEPDPGDLIYWQTDPDYR